jgi:hypothetical protein
MESDDEFGRGGRRGSRIALSAVRNGSAAALGLVSRVWLGS